MNAGDSGPARDTTVAVALAHPQVVGQASSALTPSSLTTFDLQYLDHTTPPVPQPELRIPLGILLGIPLS